MCAFDVRLRELHDSQQAIADSAAKRKVIRAGRRGGKTTLVADIAVDKFVDGVRVLYATPTQEQIDTFWKEVKWSLEILLEAGVLYKNETKHIIELPGTEQRIRAKTAWDADTLRGDYADLLILDEYQLMKASREDPSVSEAWNDVGAPMLLDNDGDAIFIYTTKRGKHHSKELYKKAEADTTGRWEVFNFPSHANPFLSPAALQEIASDMTRLAYRMEILAEEIDDDPNALWNRDIIHHVTEHPPLLRVVVGVDPPGKAAGAECGIVAAGIGMWKGEVHGFVLDDRSLRGSPKTWGTAVVVTYNRNDASRVIGEINFGGEMVEHTIRSIEGGEDIPYKPVRASRGKAIRAEPVVAFYERGRIHHLGNFEELEDEMCLDGETTVITRQGPMPLQQLDGMKIKILGGDGEWHLATGHYYGKQSAVEITLSRHGHKEVLAATYDHRWFVDHTPRWASYHSKYVKRTRTKELEIGNLVSGRTRRNLLSHVQLNPIGVMAGFVYGDGWKDRAGCGVAFYEHDNDVIPWFGPKARECLRPFKTELGTQGYRLNGLPHFLKREPDFFESSSFLYGWLAGYFAADGSISNDSQCVLYSANRKSLEIARHVCVLLGVQNGPISNYKRMDVKEKYITDEPMYKFTLMPGSLREDFFLKAYHREAWLTLQERGFKNSYLRWRIEEIKPCGKIDTFCLNVPSDHRFILADTNIISGNCNWVPESGALSPNRIDGLVWAMTDLMIEKRKKKAGPFR